MPIGKRERMQKKLASEWKVYIIQTSSGKLYTGITNHIEERFKAHLSKSGAKFFHFSSPEKIVYSETLPNRSEASKRECSIKKMTRQEKLNLISVSVKDSR